MDSPRPRPNAATRSVVTNLCHSVSLAYLWLGNAFHFCGIYLESAYPIRISTTLSPQYAIPILQLKLSPSPTLPRVSLSATFFN